MNLAVSPATPARNRHEIEHLVRRAVYQRLGRTPPRSALAPNPLVVNVSARHCHLTQGAVEALFGKGAKLTPMKWLYQEGQFATKETVTLIGPRSRVISNLRILGPCRDFNQVELALTDSIALGFTIPVRLSGTIKESPGCMLMGPAGFYELEEGGPQFHFNMGEGPGASDHGRHADSDVLEPIPACWRRRTLRAVCLRRHREIRHPIVLIVQHQTTAG